jgi:hypothetical protein
VAEFTGFHLQVNVRVPANATVDPGNLALTLFKTFNTWIPFFLLQGRMCAETALANLFPIAHLCFPTLLTQTGTRAVRHRSILSRATSRGWR